MELDEFCCVCVQKNLHLELIENLDENEIKYSEKLCLCDNNQEWKREYKICINCIAQLNLAYNFIQMCFKSKELRESIKSEQQKAYPCDQCNKKFLQKSSLLTHIIIIHNEQKPEESEQHFDSRDNKIEIENDKLSECVINEVKTEGNNYSSEEEEERPKPVLKKKYNKLKVPLTCEYCGKNFNRRQHYTAHIRAKHTFEKPYKCDLCDAKFTNSHSLLVHKRNHNNEKPFVCSYCGKCFVCSGDLYHHSKIHLNKREYKCNLCDKSFNTTSILRTHKICMHVEPKDWKYICKYCEKRFPINSSLVTHMKRHEGIKEVDCHICDKKFFDKSELSKHFRSHNNERQFKCNICQDKEYKNHYGLKKHLKIIHNIGSINIPKPEKKFACPLCSKTFAFNNKLQKHLCTHTGIKPFKCLHCDKRFIENYYMKMHLKKKHNIDSATAEVG
ncbi:unnamed protein product [Diabrotica balteata]|uniref:C2H2-type domain-containing protein n=1 Tax=Diabrotica balteata TaxID=107213 RepID=A0A9N9XCU5_DIABA|nr:unnamed protein product [Diabrotica balteata]